MRAGRIRIVRCLLLLAVFATANAMHTQKERYLDKPAAGDSAGIVLRGARTAATHTRNMLQSLAGLSAAVQDRPFLSSRRMLQERSILAAQGSDSPQSSDQLRRQQPRPSYGPYGNSGYSGGGGGGNNWGGGSSAWQNAASGSAWPNSGWGR